MAFFQWLLDTNNLPPRWYCGQWSSAMDWLPIASDLAIALAYFTIEVVENGLQTLQHTSSAATWLMT